MDGSAGLALDAVLGLLQQGDEGGAAGLGLGDDAFPYYLPQIKRLGILTIKMEDIL